MNIHMQRQTTGMPYLLKDKQCIQQITQPKMDKKRKRACSFSQVFYVEMFKYLFVSLDF